MTGRIHSIETLGALDGPGVRCVVFTQGCPLRCLYCHNPDTWNPRAGVEMAAEQVMERIRRMRPYFGDEGGVTLSGGEPLMQAQFAAEIFRLCRAEGIPTALDTSGCRMDDPVRACLDMTDMVILDIKHTDPGKFHQLTGGRFNTLRDFLALVASKKIPLWIRQVIIPGWNDSEEQVKALVELLRHIPTVKEVELLPYHDMAREKYAALNIEYPLSSTPPMPLDRLSQLQELADRLCHKSPIC